MSIARSLIDTVGIELEFGNLTQDSAINLVQSNNDLYGWRVHNDASINHVKGYIYGIPYPLSSVKRSGLINTTTYGAEIVSPPIDTLESSNWQRQLQTIFDFAERAKEVPQNDTSVHIHLNSAGVPLFVVQNLLRLWNGLEASMYRLGIAEKGDHRGEYNSDYKYCRPLSNPQAVISDNCLRRSFSVQQMLKAKTYAQFFQAYGNVSLSREPNKYHPARYTGLNFFPLQSINTIEFRVFNMTQDVKNVIAWIKLCQAMMRQSFGKPIELEDQPLGFTSNSFGVPNIQAILELDDDLCLQLEHLWNMGSWCNPVKGNLFTHSSFNKIVWDSNKFQADPIESAVAYKKQEDGSIIQEIVTYDSLTGGNSSRSRPRFTIVSASTEINSSSPEYLWTDSNNDDDDDDDDDED